MVRPADVRVALAGLALFAFMPLVLVLFFRQPFGPGWSAGLGIVVMLGHRFLAAPWAFAHAGSRCAWCAGHVEPASGERFEVESGGRVWPLVACSPHHAGAVGRYLSFLRRWRPAIAAGIFPALLLLLTGSVAEATGHPFATHESLALVFRVLVAATVVTASLAYRLVAEPDAHLVVAFPLHNLLLLGVRQTLWVFRLVGAWWLLDALARSLLARVP